MTVIDLTEQQIVQFFKDDLAINVDDIDAASLLFSTGIIDSFALVSLMLFIETECGFRISPTDVNLANFDSIERIIAYVARR